MAYTVVSHFTKSDPDVRATYAAILEAARKLGKVQEDPKKTSIHLVRASAFAGVAAQKQALVLTLKASKPIQSPRIRRTEQTSANRWHMEMRLTSPAEVDAELRQWLAEAYALA
ncbi:MAG TPA: DUF5655 domain-containing protein [Candidatus Polarisedimenticolaceae bacterium]|nr:DUF5655 domain-containing protein [Candidatus Polarisedimenticolaceae bacterium]